MLIIHKHLHFLKQNTIHDMLRFYFEGLMIVRITTVINYSRKLTKRKKSGTNRSRLTLQVLYCLYAIFGIYIVSR